MKDIIATKYTAQEGFVWVRKDTPDFILGSVLYVAPNDSIVNYIEVLEPEEQPNVKTEETITLTKSEYNKNLENKYNEGVRKTENIFQEQITLLRTENQTLKVEVESLKVKDLEEKPIKK